MDQRQDTIKEEDQEIFKKKELIRKYKSEEVGLSNFEGSLALFSTNIGAGFVALPFCFYTLSIPVALGLCAFMTIITSISIDLMLETQINLKKIRCNVNSIYEIGYALMGKPSIYITSLLIFTNTLALCTMYFMLFGKMFQDVIHGFMGLNGFIASPIFWKAFLIIMLLPFFLPKEMKEIKMAAVLLLVALTAFFTILFVQLVHTHHELNTLEPAGKIVPIKLTDTSTAISTILVAFAIQQSIFPLQASLRDKSKDNTMAVCNQCTYWSTFCYCSIGVMGCLLYKSEVKLSVMENIGLKTGFLNASLLLIFCLVLGCHIPFMFFPCKETLLVMVDEFRTGSISKAMSQRIQAAGSPKESHNTDMGYKSMPDRLYYSITFALIGCLFILSIVVKDLSTLFDLVGMLACTFYIFLFPSFGWLLSVIKVNSLENTQYDVEIRQKFLKQAKSTLLIVVGVAAFTVQLVSLSTKLIS